MGWIARSLGLFYSAAALLALLTLRSAWSAERGSRQMAAPAALHERIWLGFTLVSACLYGAAGIALLLKSDAAVWMPGSGLLAQGGFYGLICMCLFQARFFSKNGFHFIGSRYSGKAQMGGGDERGRKIWSAAIVSMAVFAFSTYAARQGVLS